VAAHNGALGDALTGHVQIQAGAALHLSGGVNIGNALAIREGGVGFGNGTDGEHARSPAQHCEGHEYFDPEHEHLEREHRSGRREQPDRG